MSEALVPYDKDVARQIQETTKARALALHGAVMDRLELILNRDDDKTALTAAGLILKVGGGMKAQSIKVQATFNQLMENAAASVPGPLAALTQITASAVIDAEDDDSSDTEE